MQRQKEIIARRLAQIAKMRAYVVYSNGRMRAAGIAEKAGIIESEQDWKEPRDVRNAINHEYEEDAATLSVLATRMLELVAPLESMNERAERYCVQKLGVAVAASDGK